jgi:hypothetical protein
MGVGLPAGPRFHSAPRMLSAGRPEVTREIATPSDKREPSSRPQRPLGTQAPRKFGTNQTWGIENGPNWTMHMMWDEDTRGPCMRKQGVLATSWLRILAYNLTATVRAHLPKKDRLPASWSDAMDQVFASLLWFRGAQGAEEPTAAIA